MSNHPIVVPKKLIEVALPLDAINKACGREKSIRHGHPSTLHLWWARRPLAAARAVLFAQLVNDPSWKYSNDELKKNQVKGAITKKRNELFKLVTELVQWESTTNQEVLERAHRELLSSWRETCEANKEHPNAAMLFDPSKLPPFHDPFAGGGAIPLEAQRLGLKSYATDLNPVAVLINKAMIEIPPRFEGRRPIGPKPKGEKQTHAVAVEDWSRARGLAEDVRRYGLWMREQAEKRIGQLYPRVEITKEMAKDRPDLKPLVGEELKVIAWLWARTVKSANPAFSHVDVPLAATFLLGTKPGKEAHIEPVVEGDTYRFVVRLGRSKTLDVAKSGTKMERANFRCLMSGSPLTGEFIKAEAMAGRMGARLMATVAEGTRGRVYLDPTAAMESIAKQASPEWKPEVEFLQQALGFRIGNYGVTKWSELFTARQLVALGTFALLVQEARQLVANDAVAAGIPDAGAYADAVATYLGLAVGRVSDYCSTVCTWANNPQMEIVRGTFARQALPMTWDFAEANPFGPSTGSLEILVGWIWKAIERLPAHGFGSARQHDAAQLVDAPRASVVSTDPPYFDNIGYADLSDFFYVWLRRALQPIFPDLFSTLAVPKIEELVATPYRHGGKAHAEKFFLSGMTEAMHRLAETTHPAFPVTIYYAFKQSETESDEHGGTASTGWETFLEAVIGAGFAITGTWPMRTERGGRSRDIGSSALASSIVLVCCPRPSTATTVARKEFQRQLDRALPAALAEMTADPEAAVAPVDLAQAAIGPGMAIFSKYKAVLEADGEAMSVHNALVHINKAIDAFFAQAEGELDADTRFCISWFQQRGFEPGPYGEADVLARAKGTAVNGLEEAGVLSAPKGKVRLFRVKEYPQKWDPTADRRASVWEGCHQMCRALGESEHEAGALLARMPNKQEGIRQLAYYLYTICERQKWAEEALLYNELITSWPAIVEQSHKVGHKGTQLDLL